MTKPTGNPRGRPRKHGAYSETSLIPMTNLKLRLIDDILKGDKPIVAPADKIAVELLARNLAKIELIDRYLEENGLFEKLGNINTGKPQAILKIYWLALNSASRLCEQLGMTPTARARLGLKVAQTVDLASAIVAAKEAAEREKEHE